MGRKRLYFTEEERKAAHKEANRRWKAEHPDYQSEWRKNNKEKIAKYQTEYQAEYQAEYYQNNRDRIAKRHADYYQNNKEKLVRHQAEYRSTQFGRATHLISAYQRSDKKYNRGECTLTAEWIVEHIFNNPCHYCGKTDWTEMGCDRIDNALPHVPDNVVPCCCECNRKKARYSYDEYMKIIGEFADRLNAGDV